jgi:signal transduction histidine kinase
MRRTRDFVLPAEPDEGFRQELSEDVRFATLVVGGVEALFALSLPPAGLLAGVAIGLLTVVIAHLPNWYGRLRWVALGSSYLWLALLQWLGPSDGTLVAAAAVVVCVGVLLPHTPVEGTIHAVIVVVLGLRLWPIPLLALLGAVLGPFQYRHRRTRYDAQLLLIQSTQDLRLQQERALSSEHAASLERLAAAVSHELNTPVGAMRSSVQTLQSIQQKLGQADQPQRNKLTQLHADVCASLLASTARVQDIVERLQRLTSLDRATVRPTDINQVLADVAATAGASSEQVTIRLDLQPLPLILCQTQAWTTILTRLVLNAAAHPGERVIQLRSEMADGCISVQLIEPGRKIKAAEAARAFDPAFDQNGGRVRTSNWGLFQLRGWVQQLGGELRLFNDEAGAVTRILIPVQQTVEAASAP